MRARSSSAMQQIRNYHLVSTSWIASSLTVRLMQVVQDARAVNTGRTTRSARWRRSTVAGDRKASGAAPQLTGSRCANPTLLARSIFLRAKRVAKVVVTAYKYSMASWEQSQMFIYNIDMFIYISLYINMSCCNYLIIWPRYFQLATILFVNSLNPLSYSHPSPSPHPFLCFRSQCHLLVRRFQSQCTLCSKWTLYTLSLRWVILARRECQLQYVSWQPFNLSTHFKRQLSRWMCYYAPRSAPWDVQAHLKRGKTSKHIFKHILLNCPK